MEQNENKDAKKEVTPEQKPRPTREEIVERKVSMAMERDSRIIRINSTLGGIVFNVLRQFDQAYDSFKDQLGEPGKISHEDGKLIMDEILKLTMSFSEQTGKLSRKVNFKYYVPQELQEMQKALKKKKKDDQPVTTGMNDG
jgi:polyhydroxyalkanoate synthesis regulator phasin